MTIQAAFSELYLHSRTLRETLIGLHMTVVEDKPLQDDVVLVDLFGDTTDNLLGWLEEILLATSFSEQPFDLEKARRALTISQDRYNQLAHSYTSDLAHCERIVELAQLGRRRGGEWRAWADSVKAALEQCRQPLFDMNQALFRCWQEMTAQV